MQPGEFECVARASPNPVGPASYTARTSPGHLTSHATIAEGEPGNCAFHTSSDPSCTAAAAVLRACTSNPAKQIPSARRRSSSIDAVTSPRHTMRGSVDALNYRGGNAAPYRLEFGVHQPLAGS